MTVSMTNRWEGLWEEKVEDNDDALMGRLPRASVDSEYVWCERKKMHTAHGD